MIDFIKNLLMPSRIRHQEIEREKMSALESAEAEVKDLTARSDRAVAFLTERHQRNHYGEAIAQMIRGGVS